MRLRSRPRERTESSYDALRVISSRRSASSTASTSPAIWSAFAPASEHEWLRAGYRRGHRGARPPRRAPYRRGARTEDAPRRRCTAAAIADQLRRDAGTTRSRRADSARGNRRRRGAGDRTGSSDTRDRRRRRAASTSAWPTASRSRRHSGTKRASPRSTIAFAALCRKSGWSSLPGSPEPAHNPAPIVCTAANPAHSP